MSEMITTAQEKFRKAGYQWVEHIFNDGNENDCHIEFTKSQEPCVFNCGYPPPEDMVGWGRFPRQVAWDLAVRWLETEQ